MTADERIAALLEETKTLTVGKDSGRLCALYKEAAGLVDKNVKPKKWAAFRFLYAQALDGTDPEAALVGYRDAAGCFDLVQDRAAWMSCKACIGFGLAGLRKFEPPESEEAIACLEAVISDYPNAAGSLAQYYALRTIGDRWENWQKQVHYLEAALGQVSTQDEPLKWAELKNEIALALPREPEGDFVKATEAAIRMHEEALAVLETLRKEPASEALNQWIEVCLDLSAVYLARVGTPEAENRKAAERYARAAYDACGPSVRPVTRTLATIGLARVVLNEGESSAEGLKLCAEADGLIDAKANPVLAATNEKFKALAYLKLVERDDKTELEKLIAAAEKAYSLVGVTGDIGGRRVAMQLAAEGLFSAGEFVRAIDYLRRAVDAGEMALQQATSRAGRLESIFDLHDSYARLGFAYFQAKDIAKGVEAIDRGKGRLWRPAKTFASFVEIKTLVPKGGALLFATFAPKDGAIAVVAESGEAVCPLSGFGRERLMEILLADVLNPKSASWMGQYAHRNSNPELWREAIDSIGGELYAVLWKPVIQMLTQLGVAENAELVCFPQAGLGVLPLHAAWKADGGERVWVGEKYAIRYAPSASCLAGKTVGGEGGSLLVSDPLGDLTDSPLEMYWAQEAVGAVTVLTGCQAVKKDVMAALAGTAHVHFSTHSTFQLSDPFQSRLVMAGGEMLLLEELLPLMEKSAIREVVLSACETAMAQVTRRPDELLGFPAAFLEHGAATIVATQWPVDDWAAAVVTGRFYREWKIQKKSAAEAMRAAQNWARTVTVAELSELLRPLKKIPGAVGDRAVEIRTSLAAMDDDERPLAHPFYWAAFTVSGI